jgi:hypothetical protein
VLVLIFDNDYFSPFIVPTVGAYTVRQSHFAAVVTLDQILGFQRIMGAPAITAGAGQFLFWYRWHDFTPIFLRLTISCLPLGQAGGLYGSVACLSRGKTSFFISYSKAPIDRLPF